MWIILFTLFIAGVTTYIWCIRGFFSALIHMICVITAGAVAFGVWEPVSYLLISSLPERGFGSALGDMAWGLGLAVPFALTLAILRGIVDSLLPANAQADRTADYIGGAVCGLVSGVISAGIVVLSINFLRLEPDFGGYQPVGYTTGSARGSIERSADTFVPWVDRLTASFYSQLSLTTLRTDEPLAKWHPEFDTLPGSMRLTYDGKSRMTMRPDSVTLKNWYIVGDQAHPVKFDQLLSDAWLDAPQKVSDLKGKVFGSEEELQKGYLAGFTLRFNSKAREKTGQVVIGNGQLRLVVLNNENDDDSLALHPIAVVSRVDDPTKVAYSRFRISADNTFTSSVGGESECVMAFEFPVPGDYHPLALYVKGIRIDLTDREKPSKAFSSPSDRDEAIQTGQMAEMTDVGPIIGPDGKPVQGPAPSTFVNAWIVVSPSMGIVIQKGTENGLTVVEQARGWAVTEGEAKLRKNKNTIGMDQHLRIDRFATTEDTTIVKVTISPKERDLEFNKAWEAADRNAEPAVIDTNGTRYPAAGWVYKEANLDWVRYDRGHPIQRIGELPAVSISSTDRDLTLIFVVSAGVQISEFKVGETSMPPGVLKKPLKADVQGRH